MRCNLQFEKKIKYLKVNSFYGREGVSPCPNAVGKKNTEVI